jgi:hypothetical protein
MKARIMTIPIIVLSVICVIALACNAQAPWPEHIVASNLDSPESVFAIDLDTDGDTDILAAVYHADDITWWENDGDENFTEHIIAGDFINAYSVFAFDVDTDGDVDVLGAAYNADAIAWWENDGNQNFTEHTIDEDFDGAESVYAIDLDDDGDVDVLGAARQGDQIAWWENDGFENFTEHIIDDYFNAAKSVFAIDVDGDGDVDVLGAARSANDITWWENDGEENFTEHTIDGDYDGAWSVYAIDVDSDDDVDVLGAAFDVDEITWWENDGNERFTEHTITDDYYAANSVYATDVDGDGDVDILGAAFDGNDITWWENDGAQNFIQHTVDDYFIGARSVYATDIDGDGDVDILGAAYEGGEISWWEQPASLEIALNPLGMPIVIPPQGGVFAFVVSVSNYDVEIHTAEVWFAIETPGSSQFLIFGPNEFTFVPGLTISHMLFQIVPRNAPAGEYTFNAFLGEHPWNVMSSDFFRFAKEGESRDWTGQDGWELTGDFFDDALEIAETIPIELEMLSAHPNPFNPTTSISFALPVSARVTLAVYDISGRQVATLVGGWREVGVHEVTFDGSGFASGIYIYRLEADQFSAHGKMVLLK